MIIIIQLILEYIKFHKVLNMFPEEFKKGYRLFERGKLKPVFAGDESGWYLLDPKKTVKFNINE